MYLKLIDFWVPLKKVIVNVQSLMVLSLIARATSNFDCATETRKYDKNDKNKYLHTDIHDNNNNNNNRFNFLRW